MTDIHLPLTGNGSEHRSPLSMPPCKTSAPVASKKHGAPETPLSMVSIAISEDIRRVKKQLAWFSIASTLTGQTLEVALLEGLSDIFGSQILKVTLLLIGNSPYHSRQRKAQDGGAEPFSSYGETWPLLD